MKTITFYSYKGGVGRTLLLVNIANFLSSIGKKVIMFDFDLEAPGIHHKFDVAEKVNHGFIDYLTSSFESEINHEKKIRIEDCIVEINTNLHLLPAGNSPSSQYAHKLASINWHNFYYGNKYASNDFFNNLFETVEKKYNPDYLLIDSRTGLSDIGGHIIRNYADTLICLMLNNKENLDGTTYILNTILNRKKEIKIYPIITRLPDVEMTIDISDEIVEKFKILSENIETPSILHSQPSLEIHEELELSNKKILRNSIILQDYLKFIRLLFPQESTKYQNIIKLIDEKGNFNSLSKYTNYNYIAKKPFNRFLSNNNKILRTAGPNYFKNVLFEEFNNRLLSYLKNYLNFNKINKVKNRQVNWDLLGFEIQERSIDFCNDLYFLTNTRNLLVDIIEIGSLKSYTILSDYNSDVYHQLRKSLQKFVRNDKRYFTNCFEDIINEIPDLYIGVLGDQAATSEVYRDLSKLKINDEKSFYENIKPKKDEKELLDWLFYGLTRNLKNRIIICDHATAINILEKYNKSKYFSDEFRFSLASRINDDLLKDLYKKEPLFEVNFKEPIPIGFVYYKEDVMLRYHINKSLSSALLDAMKDNNNFWDDFCNYLKNNNITPFSWRELSSNITWDLNLAEAVDWQSKIKSLDV